MSDLITVTGVVATDPRHLTTTGGLEITSFRLAAGQRRYDKEKQKWVDAETNWYTVTGFRQLAANLVTSIERGQHVLVSGRLRVRSWESGEKSGTSVEIEADAIGHHLGFGTSVHTKTAPVNASGGRPTGDEPGWAPAPMSDRPGGAGSGDDGSGSGSGGDRSAGDSSSGAVGILHQPEHALAPF